MFEETQPFVVPPRGENVLVLAGTYQQAKEWAEGLRLSPKDWTFVSRLTLHGWMHPLVYLVGTWFERDDLPFLETALIPTRPKVMSGEGWRS